MTSGYIYVLINESMKGLIKIGITKINPSKRARDLSSNTGIPTPFKVAYELFVENCAELERKLHIELEDFRVNQRREFFNYPLSKAIDLVQSFSEKEINRNESYESIEILKELKRKYGQSIKEEVTSVKLYQTEDRVSLEVTCDYQIGDNLLDQIINRTDLGFIYDGENKSFNPKETIQSNVKAFLSCSPATHVVSYSNLFTEKDAERLYNLDSL